jgi:hypothetical protein
VNGAKIVVGAMPAAPELAALHQVLSPPDEAPTLAETAHGR